MRIPDSDLSESNSVEIAQPNGIMTRHTLRPNYTVGGKAVTAEEISASQRTDPELKRMLQSQPLRSKTASTLTAFYVGKDGNRMFRASYVSLFSKCSTN